VTEQGETLELVRCESCHAQFVPTDGPCPRCASTATRPVRAPAIGTVVAATDLLAPAPGWSAPHPLLLVELAETVRLLAIGDRPALARGTVVAVRWDGTVYRATPDPAARRKRGEGESPKTR
jgi:uncharacterized OB-fold protein